jgi:hypothetical protein
MLLVIRGYCLSHQDCTYMLSTIRSPLRVVLQLPGCYQLLVIHSAELVAVSKIFTACNIIPRRRDSGDTVNGYLFSITTWRDTLGRFAPGLVGIQFVP